MYLYTIRHGQSMGNLPGAENSHEDPGLTELGKAQSARLAAWLPTFLPKVDAIYCSSMRRARETVAPIAATYDMAPTFEDALREIGTNRWDHLAYETGKMPTLTEGFWAAEQPYRAFRGDDGESLMHFRTRIGRFVETLRERHQGEVVLVVCHGGVVEFVFDHVLNIGPWRRCGIQTRNTAISLFQHVAKDHKPERWRLRFHDRTDHLPAVE